MTTTTGRAGSTVQPIDEVQPAGGWMPCPAPTWAAPLTAVDEYTVQPHLDGLLVRSRTLIGRDPQTLRGHFPGLPVYPGVFLLETLAQAVTAAVAGPRPLRLEAVHSVRFLRALRPGDVLSVETEVGPAGPSAAREVIARATSLRGDRVADVRARLSPLPASTPSPSTGGGNAQVEGMRWAHPAVRELLPQRYPLLLVDRVVAHRPGRALVAEKAISATESCYGFRTGPWAPGADAYPVSLHLESLGQAAALLWLADQAPPDTVAGPDQVLMFAGMRGYRVTGQAFPGDVLRHEVELTAVRAGTAFAAGQTWADGRLVATVDTLIAVCRPGSVLDSRREETTTGQEALG